MEVTIQEILRQVENYKVCENDNVLNKKEATECQYCSGKVFYPNGFNVKREVYTQMGMWADFYKPELFNKLLLNV